MRAILRFSFALAGLFLVLPAWAAEPEKPAKPKKPLTSESDELGGKTFRDWMKDLKTSHDPAVVENAIRTILLYDPDLAQEAVPVILEKLRYPRDLDVSIKVSMAYFLGRAELGDHREKAVRKLIALVDTTDQVIVKMYGILALARLGRDAQAASDMLRRNLGHYSWEIRKASALALAAVARPKEGKWADAAVLERLISRLLSDTCFQVRLEIARTLVVLGPPSASDMRTKELRTKMINDLRRVARRTREDKTVRIWAHVAAVRMLGKTEDKEVAFVAAQLHDPILLVRMEAARALSVLHLMGADVKRELPLLVNALGDKDPIMVDAVVAALKTIGKPAVRYLGDKLTSEELGVRIGAARALGAIGAPDAETQIQPLLQALNDPEPAMVEAATLALGRMGKAVVPTASKLLSDRNMKLRYAGARILAAVGPDAAAEVDELRKALWDPDKTLSALALNALGSIGRGSLPVVPDLQKLAQKNPELKKAVTQVIEAINTDSGKQEK